MKYLFLILIIPSITFGMGAQFDNCRIVGMNLDGSVKDVKGDTNYVVCGDESIGRVECGFFEGKMKKGDNKSKPYSVINMATAKVEEFKLFMSEDGSTRVYIYKSGKAISISEFTIPKKGLFARKYCTGVGVL